MPQAILLGICSGVALTPLLSYAGDLEVQEIQEGVQEEFEESDLPELPSLTSDFYPDTTQWGFQFHSTLSSDLIPALNSLMGSSGSPIRLRDTFQSRYGQHEEAFSELILGVDEIPWSRDVGLFQRAYLELHLEMALSGVFQNPVVSELQGKLEGVTYLHTGFRGEIPFGFQPSQHSGQSSGQSLSGKLSTQLGIVAGLGLGKRTDLIGPDFLDIAPPTSESLRLVGGEIHLQASNSPQSNFQLHTQASYLGTLFSSSLGEVTAIHRWNINANVENQKWTQFTQLQIKPHIILGPQPLPIPLLPKVWDFIHPDAFQRPLSQEMGLGIELSPMILFNNKLHWILGSYSNFFGSSLSYHSSSFDLRLGTWGINLGSNAQVNSERLWECSLSTRF